MKPQIDPHGRQPANGMVSKTTKGILNVLLAAILSATLFTALPATGIGLNSSPLQSINGVGESANAATPQLSLHVGLVVGHWGHGDDVGAVCSESLGGFKEVDINYTIADLTRQYLESEGIQVDMLKEFDPHLDGYQSNALISIHADTCEYIPELGTGFKIAEAADNKRPEQAARLMACLKNRYAEAVDPNTPAVIIETGYMNQDRELLTQNPALVARGITAGIMCFLNREVISPE